MMHRISRRWTPSSLLWLFTVAVSSIGHPLGAQVTPPQATGSGAGQAAPPVQADDLLILGGRLWDGLGDEARPNPGILVRNGTILHIGPVDPMGSGARAVLLDDEHFIMPGLFDLHAHYAVDLFGEGRVDEYTVNPVIFLANGVTSTFPAGEVDPSEAARGRRRVAAGEIPGPRIYASGPYWGTARPGWSHEAMTPDSIRREAAAWALEGVRGFKAKGIRPEQLDALIEVAHEHGLTVTGHLDSGYRRSVNPRDAILMGIDRIEHFLGGAALPSEQSAYASLESLDLDDPDTARQVLDQARLFVNHGTYFDATLTAYGYFADREPIVFDYWFDEMGLLTPYAREVVEGNLPREPSEQFRRIYYVKRQTVKAFWDAGAGDQLTLGTDHPSWGEFFSGFGAHRELHAMVLAGIPNAGALRAGTVNAAKAMDVDERLGSIEVGKYADLLVVSGDPLADITDTRNGHVVVRSGRVYEPRRLLESIRGRMGPRGPDDGDWWRGNVRLGR
ncbi:MAG: amidohydrolase family protein [Gemmatimonadetes bacterium]|nr:amidohydrolase family protein [Gemmatimonadota bacterium]